MTGVSGIYQTTNWIQLTELIVKVNPKLILSFNKTARISAKPWMFRLPFIV